MAKALWERFLHAEAWRQNRVLVGLTLFYFIAVFVAAVSTGKLHQFQPTVYWGHAFSITLYSMFLFFLVWFLYMILVKRPLRPLTSFFQWLKGQVTDVNYLISAGIAAVAIPTVESLYSSFKTMITAIVPFYGDPVFAQIDRALHFGVDPWVITHALFPGADWAFWIGLFYVLWFFLLWAFMVHAIFFLRDTKKRMRFLVGFTLSWMVIGSFAAMLLSSAGPVYYADVTGLESPFAPLMGQLYAFDAEMRGPGTIKGLWALTVQDQLWAYYVNDTPSLGSGISAMPSMHISTTALMTFHAFTLRKWLGGLMAVFLVTMVIGSVHLGWHYAIDGYVSIIATYLIWRYSRPLTEWAMAPRENRMERQPAKA